MTFVLVALWLGVLTSTQGPGIPMMLRSQPTVDAARTMVVPCVMEAGLENAVLRVGGAVAVIPTADLGASMENVTRG